MNSRRTDWTHYPRSCGALLHITSLPGPSGIGDLGDAAYRFVDWLRASGVGIWQVLPTNPTSAGSLHSPYSCLSTFAGEPLLISLETMVEQGLLEPGELASAPRFPNDRVDFARLVPWKLQVLKTAFERFSRDASSAQLGHFEAFCHQNSDWLDDYALFSALKEVHNQSLWTEWEQGVVLRVPDVVEMWRKKLSGTVARLKFCQFVFASQWHALRSYARRNGVRLMGDLPIFVAHDSADVWSRPELFQMTPERQLIAVAGVPPDLFSSTGQRWGNPLYAWDEHWREEYRWWLARLEAAFDLVDLVRIDHFLGFLRAWAIPADSDTALRGQWQPGPGERFFRAVREKLGTVPLVLEDLGLLTPEAERLRDDLGLPGMRVLQFAFGEGADAYHLPHNSPRNAVIYTGTHDNDTTNGWISSHCSAAGEPDEIASYALRYTRSATGEFHWGMIATAFSSRCHTAIVPVQDFLGLDSAGRMNVPSTTVGNWSWQLKHDQLGELESRQIRELAETYGRVGSSDAAKVARPSEQ